LGVIRPYSLVGEGVKLYVFLIPKTKTDKVGGVEVICSEGGVDKAFLRVKVRALPDKGLANKALIKLIAKWIGISKSHVSLVAGAASRKKTMLIAGQSADLSQRLDDLIKS